MRILHVLDHSLPLHSGYAFRTAAILREQRARGWDTVQLTTPRHGKFAANPESASGWHFHRTALQPGILSKLPAGAYVEEMRATSRRIRELAVQQDVDVLHAHSPVLNALPAIWAGRALRLPVVYELRALWEDAAVDHGTTVEGSLRYKLSRMLETYALKRVDHVTTICEGLRKEIITRGLAADRVTVIPNAVDTEAFTPQGEPDLALRAKLGLQDATIVLGFAGSFYGYEGLDLLLDAMAQLRAEHPGVKALLVGGGPQDQQLRAQASQLGLQDAVIFTGRVPHGEVQRYYDLIDVLAYPRKRMRLTELVTPLKPLEAMAQGRLFVASDVGGHHELIRDGETGLLFKADDAAALAQAIRRLLAMRSEWPKIRAQARRFVEIERTWSLSVARYAPVYERLTAPARQTVRA